MPRLHIYDRRERAVVSAADRMLAGAVQLARPFRRRNPPADPRRILLLRLERIGDLVMTLAAIDDVAAAAPAAELTLVVGSWNAGLARAIARVSRVELLDAAWLARDGGGLGPARLLRAARAWRRQRYDVAINFEPDVRSNLLLAGSGAAWTAGYSSGGGGALLDVALEYDVRAHTSDNARRLVAAVLGDRKGTGAGGLTIPPAEAQAAERRVPRAGRPVVGIHASGGRAIKQWPIERFAEIARKLVAEADATIVLTGSAQDRPLVDRVRAGLPEERVVDVAGDADLVSTAAVLQRLDVLVTGDTGPMHLAAAVGTPVVAVFGPSDPARYAPRGPRDRIVRIDLPCAPCNRIRRPPERCAGHTPDCLAGVTTDLVWQAVVGALDRSRPRAVAGTDPQHQ
jgi:ADP-heptose:LPS heptosyltransferase